MVEPRVVVCEGYLRKSPPEEKIVKKYKWRKRFFKLWSDRTLEYYKHVTDSKPLKEPIALAACIGVMDTEDEYMKYLRKTKFKYPFCVSTPRRLYHLAALSEKDRDMWKNDICKVCRFGPEMRPADQDITDILQQEIPPEPRHYSVNSRKSSSSKKSRGSTTESTPSTPSSPESSNTSSIRYTDETPNDDDELWSTSSEEDLEEESIYDKPPTPRRVSFIERLDNPSSPNFDNRSHQPIYPGINERLFVATARNVNGNPLSDSYETMESPSFSGTHSSMIYDTPPKAKWKSQSLKQNPTNVIVAAPNISDKGYVDMKTALAFDDDYIKVHDRSISSVREPRKFREVGTFAPFKKSATLPSHPFEHPKTLHPARQDIIDEDPLQAVPKMDNKIVHEVQYAMNNDDAPPVVSRESKPSPHIDRSKKPFKSPLKKQQSYVASKPSLKDANRINRSFDLSAHRRAYEVTDYPQHNFSKGNNNNLFDRELPNFDNNEPSYYNKPAKLNGMKELLDNSEGAYHNIETANISPRNRTISSDDNMSDLADNYHNIHITNHPRQAHTPYNAYTDDDTYVTVSLSGIDYKNADLPPEPTNGEHLESESSYENIKARHSTTGTLTYIECNAHGSDDVFTEHTEVGATKNGTHYIVVDPLKSEAVKHMR